MGSFRKHLGLLGEYFAQYLKVRVSYRGDFLIGLFTSFAATILLASASSGFFSRITSSWRAGASSKSYFFMVSR